MQIDERIGIFQGKKGKYNKLILRALNEEGYLSAWQMAKYIVENYREKQKGNWYYEAQKINSILTRKNGRLEELTNKEYIQKTPRGYRTTYPKGYCLALTLNYLENKDIKIPKIDVLDINLLLQGAKVQYPMADADYLADLKEILEIYAELYTKEEAYEVLAKATSELLDRGLNLDVVSNKESQGFLQTHLENMLKEELEQGKKWNKLDENPELRERYFDLILKLTKKTKEHWKELEKTLDSLEDKLRKFQKKGVARAGKTPTKSRPEQKTKERANLA